MSAGGGVLGASALAGASALGASALAGVGVPATWGVVEVCVLSLAIRRNASTGFSPRFCGSTILFWVSSHTHPSLMSFVSPVPISAPAPVPIASMASSRDFPARAANAFAAVSSNTVGWIGVPSSLWVLAWALNHSSDAWLYSSRVG